jgi:hypothetical protein
MAAVEMAFVQAMGPGAVTGAIAKDARMAETVLVAAAIVALADFFE